MSNNELWRAFPTKRRPGKSRGKASLPGHRNPLDGPQHGGSDLVLEEGGLFWKLGGAFERSRNQGQRQRARSKARLGSRAKVKGVGQECPTHTGNLNTKSKATEKECSSHMGCSLFAGEDDFGVEEGAGEAGGDGEEVGLSGEDFYVAGAGNLGEIDGAAVANAGGGGFVGSDGGELWEELAGVDEKRFEALCSGVDGGFSIFICTAQDSRFLHFASLSLRESEAPVGMTNLHFLAFDVLAFDFFYGVGLGDVEFGDGGAAKGLEMSSAAEKLAHIVGD